MVEYAYLYVTTAQYDQAWLTNPLPDGCRQIGRDCILEIRAQWQL